MKGPGTDDGQPHVVIVGAGFGGLAVARRLGGAPCRVTVIDRQNFHLFVPLLYQVATAVLSPGDIASPIRHVLSRHPNIDVLLGEVIGVDTAGKRVLLNDRAIGYDVLVLATGSGQSYFGHPEWSAHAPGLKAIEDATEIRRKLLAGIEEADRTTDEARRRALMTVVLVGGGPTGVELAGSISELMRQSLKHEFRNMDPDQGRIVLVEATSRLLGSFPPSLAEHARRVLEGHGVELRFDAPVEDVKEGYVVAGGDRIDAGTIVWTAGVAASPAGAWLGSETDRTGRTVVDGHLAVPGVDQVYVIGDTALVRDGDGEPLPGLAQVAKQQGLYLGGALAGRMAGRSWPGPFRFRNYGNMATIGRNQAVADFGRWKTAGFFAWVLWNIVHVFLLIGFRNRVIVTLQWLWVYATYQRSERLIIGDRDHAPANGTEHRAHPFDGGRPTPEAAPMNPAKHSPRPDKQDRRHTPKQDDGKPQADDQIDEAGEESFPASDPPAYTPQKTGG